MVGQISGRTTNVELELIKRLRGVRAIFVTDTEIEIVTDTDIEIEKWTNESPLAVILYEMETMVLSDVITQSNNDF